MNIRITMVDGSTKTISDLTGTFLDFIEKNGNATFISLNDITTGQIFSILK